MYNYNSMSKNIGRVRLVVLSLNRMLVVVLLWLVAGMLFVVNGYQAQVYACINPLVNQEIYSLSDNIVGADTAGVVFMESPQNLQLYPRDENNKAEVVFSGYVMVPGYQSIEVRSWADGVIWVIESEPLVYQEDCAVGGFAESLLGAAPFRISVTIEAGLVNYDFRVFLADASDDNDLTEVTDGYVHSVVAGDVYLLQGQSNTVAADYYSEHIANAKLQRDWIRSYGSASYDPLDVETDHEWHLADGEGIYGPGTVGAWGLRMSQLIVDNYKVPIGILNGSVGGTAINYHLRDEHNRTNLYTNYGRLLYRSQSAGIANMAKAILWYQGESDGGNLPRNYFNSFLDLYRDWNEDYPGIKKVYVFQVRDGCGEPQLPLRELQRRLGDIFSKVEVMSTTAAPFHDTCHYMYAGYEELGNRITRLVARDFYGFSHLSNITPPNAKYAYYTSGLRDEIIITFRDPEYQHLNWSGTRSDFLLVGDDTTTIISGRIVNNNEILLLLSGSSTATGVSYNGHRGDGPWVFNDKGIGLLTFYNLHIK